jgi:PleD family two-component response regulator
VNQPDPFAEEEAADDSVITQIQPALATLVPRVLLVDDDEIAVERMRDLVTAAGYDVTTAPSGEEALASLENEFAPIVIVDRNMPGMDGLEVCRAIRAEKNLPGYVYIMLCTVHSSEDEIFTGLNAGADDYVSKRASGAQLLARLSTARRILTLEQSLKQVIEERRRMAMTDALTGAHNRRYFMHHARGELKRTRRFGGDFAFAVFDIDHFKHINDRFGHSAGDAVLSEFVRRVDECLYSSKYNGRNRVTVDESHEVRKVQPRTLKTLMYVDDDADIREIVEMSLGLDGNLRVISSDGGERALVKMRVENPDLVVLDVMMPAMDGPTLLKRMRSDPDLRNIPVIFMTAKSSSDEVKRLLELSAIGVIAKPFDPMALGGQVKALWNSQ